MISAKQIFLIPLAYLIIVGSKLLFLLAFESPQAPQKAQSFKTITAHL